MNNRSKKRKNGILLYGLIVFVILYTLFFLIGYAFVYVNNRIQNNAINYEQESSLNFGRNVLETTASSLLSDVLFLEDYMKTVQSKDEIIYHWMLFMEHKKNYDQIRLLNLEGKEVIRINNLQSGPTLVSNENLQDKSHRFYYKETINLNQGEVVFSPLDLNIEFGIIETPIKPMIRISTPFYDNENNKKGIIVLNYHAANMLKILESVFNADYSKMMFLNNDGGYIINTIHREKEWKFMETSQSGFAVDYPEEWKKIITSDNGRIYTKNGLFSFVNLQKTQLTDLVSFEKSPSHAGENSYLVTCIPPSEEEYTAYEDNIFTQIYYSFQEYTALWIGITFLVNIIAILFIINKRNIERIRYFSEYDATTNTFNRRAGIERIESLLKKDIQITFCYIDVNGLKQVNDTLGHIAGDELILTAVNAIQNNTRTEDILIRMGGDEFLTAFVGIDENKAEEIWQRIILDLQQINETENRAYTISVSHGIVMLLHTANKTIEDFLIKADELMYKEKQEIKKGLKIIR